MEFRSIPRCNFVGKCITKILVSRLKPILPYLVSSNQSEIIEGRKIGDNVMIAHDLQGIIIVKLSPISNITADMTKAFDSIS